MNPYVAPALIAGGGQAAGGISGAVSAKKRQQRAQQYYVSNANMMQRFYEKNQSQAQAYMREGRQTQFQDTVQSMRDAGLNPMMMYGGASGAQASAVQGGTGGSGTGGAPPGTSIGFGSDVLSTAYDKKRMNAQVKDIEAGIKLKTLLGKTELTKQVKNLTDFGSVFTKPVGDMLKSALGAKLFPQIFGTSAKDYSNLKEGKPQSGQPLGKQSDETLGMFFTPEQIKALRKSK